MSLGLGLTVLVAIALIEGNLARQVDRACRRRRRASIFIDIQPDQVATFDALVRASPGRASCERVPMLRGRITAVNGTSPESLEIRPTSPGCSAATAA